MAVAQSLAGTSGDASTVQSAAGEGARYAVLFRTHVWDGFVGRQFRRLATQVGTGDLFVVANAPASVLPESPELPLVTFREDDIADMGYALVGTDGVFWYNIDYPLYYFAARYPEYDYYVVCEYDVVVNVALDALIAGMHARGADAVGLSTEQPRGAWWFRPSCEGIYPDAEVQRMLFPFGVFSKRALAHLSARKIELSKRLRAGTISVWPHCELFIPTELAMTGFSVDELAQYGSTARFDYAPAYLEDDLDDLQGEGFIHPLLDAQRYVASTLKYDYRPERFFLPRSALRRRLSRLAVHDYGPHLRRALRRRARRLLTVARQEITATLDRRLGRSDVLLETDYATQQLPARRGSVPPSRTPPQ